MTETLPPRTMRTISICMPDDLIDHLDILARTLPDARSRSALVVHLLQLSIGTLTNPAEAIPALIEAALDDITRQALDEIEAWRVPDLVLETETAGTA